MASSKEIRRRIRSISNTQQIIGAMELVSVVKMQKAVQNNLAARDFTKSADIILSDVCRGLDENINPLFKSREIKNRLIVVITSNRGLCGSLNAKILKTVIETLKDNLPTNFITIGKKGRDFLASNGQNILADFSDISDDINFENIIPITHLIVGEYISGKYDEVKIIYSHFESSLSQVATCTDLLPIEFCSNKETHVENLIKFEPSKIEIIEKLLPRILETKLWQTVLESVASEHSARMVSMKNANENAEDLIFDLTLTYNQTRQSNITQEIAEISAGKMTLES